MERFIQKAHAILSPLIAHPLTVNEIETPPDPQLGDVAFPCFKLAKTLRKSPPAIATELAALIQSQKQLPEGWSVEAAGPYVNFRVSPPLLVRTLLTDLLAPTQNPNATRYGTLPKNSRGRWVLEYSSPNVAKPLNIYHLRPTALGAALDKMGRKRGYQVTSINHLGDWGKQYGMLTVAFRLFGKTIRDELSMMELVDLYVRVNQEAAQHPELEDEARAAFLKLEKGDPEVHALWKKCVDVSIEEFERIYSRLGVNFDHIWGESYYQAQLEPLLSHLKEQKILQESEGAWIVPVEDENGKELTPCILQKSDGATIYATRDVAAAIYRFQRFQFDRMTYIVGGEQRLHFQQVFGVLRKMGHTWVDRCEHVPTGLYRFKDAKMSTRKGNFVTLEEVLEQAKVRVRSLIEARAQRDDAAAQHAHQAGDDICEAVAIGAVIYHDLSTDPARDVDFDLERVVDFEGETGPYLQYAHTRCLGILRKAQDQGLLPHWSALDLSSVATELREPSELSLVKVLGQYPLQIERALQNAKASHLAHYLMDLTQAFTRFYQDCKVIDPQNTSRSHARLALIEATRGVLNEGLDLILVPRPEKM